LIAIIIINFGSPELTIRFVREECAKIQLEHTVIVVDNASTDKSFGKLQQDLPTAHILRCPENQGFARANNQGAKYAICYFNPSFILFTNNDIHIREFGVVEEMMTCLDNHPDAAAVGPEVIGPDGRRQGPEPKMSFAQRHLLPYWGKLFLSRQKLAQKTALNYAQSASEGWHHHVSGSFFLVRTTDFIQAGMFDPATFLYAEEPILSERFAAIGKKVWFCPRVGVVHDHGATTKKKYGYVRMRRLKFESECYYFSEYLNTPRYLLLLGRLTIFLKEKLGR